VTFAKVLAPFMPFLTETVHQRLIRPVDPKAPESVHFSDYPQAKRELIDLALEEQMGVARSVVASGLLESLRDPVFEGATAPGTRTGRGRSVPYRQVLQVA